MHEFDERQAQAYQGDDTNPERGDPPGHSDSGPGVSAEELLGASSFGGLAMDDAAAIISDELARKIAENALRELREYDSDQPVPSIALRVLDVGPVKNGTTPDVLGLVKDLAVLADRSATLRRQALGRSMAGAALTGAWWLPMVYDEVQRPRPQGVSRAALEGLIRAIRAGDRSAESELMAIAGTAVSRYCRALTVLNQVSRWTACMAARHAVDRIRVLIRSHAYGESGELLAKICEITEEAVRRVSDSEASFTRRVQWRNLFPDGTSRASVPDDDSGASRDGDSVMYFEPYMLKVLIGNLPEDERRVVVLRAMVGLDVEVTAQAICRDPDSVRGLQHAAISRLYEDMDSSKGGVGVGSDGPHSLDEIRSELRQLAKAALVECDGYAMLSPATC